MGAQLFQKCPKCAKISSLHNHHKTPWLNNVEVSRDEQYIGIITKYRINYFAHVNYLNKIIIQLLDYCGMLCVELQWNAELIINCLLF